MKYVFETMGGFRFERDTPEEIVDIFRENYEELCNMCADGDSAYKKLDLRDRQKPKGIISAYIGGCRRTYNLYAI